MDTLRQASLGALPESMWLSGCVEGQELLTLFFDSDLVPEFESILPDSADGHSMSFGVFGLLWTVVHKVSSTSAEHAEVI